MTTFRLKLAEWTALALGIMVCSLDVGTHLGWIDLNLKINDVAWLSLAAGCFILVWGFRTRRLFRALGYVCVLELCLSVGVHLGWIRIVVPSTDIEALFFGATCFVLDWGLRYIKTGSDSRRKARVYLFGGYLGILLLVADFLYNFHLLKYRHHYITRHEEPILAAVAIVICFFLAWRFNQNYRSR